MLLFKLILWRGYSRFDIILFMCMNKNKWRALKLSKWMNGSVLSLSLFWRDVRILQIPQRELILHTSECLWHFYENCLVWNIDLIYVALLFLTSFKICTRTPCAIFTIYSSFLASWEKCWLSPAEHLKQTTCAKRYTVESRKEFIWLLSKSFSCMLSSLPISRCSFCFQCSNTALSLF